MADFIIDGTNFGIEENESSIELAEANDGQLLLTLELNGNQKQYEALTEDEDSPWSWTLYPPEFYLRRYPVPGAAKTDSVTLKLGTLDPGVTRLPST